MPLYERFRDGGLAEYIRAPAWLVDELPENVNFDVGAKLHDMATAYHTLKVAQLPPASTVIVTAATGSIGSITVKLALLFGISRLILISRSAQSLEAVQKLSAIKCDVVALDDLGEDWPETKALVRRLRQLTPLGADAIIDLMPSGTDIWQVLGALAVNGTVVHLGASSATLPLPLVAFMANCWRLVGTRNHSRSDAQMILQLLKDGRLKADELITHRFSFGDVEKAVTLLHDRSEPVWMMVVNPNE